MILKHAIVSNSDMLREKFLSLPGQLYCLLHQLTCSLDVIDDTDSLFRLEAEGDTLALLTLELSVSLSWLYGVAEE